VNEFFDTPKYDDLIYDIGMHKGEDSEFYLRKGFRVVAVEADPDLVRHCRNRLRRFIDQGQLIIVEGAIVDVDSTETGRTAIFYKNDTQSIWGTVSPDWAECNERYGTVSRTIEVGTIDLRRVLQQHGVPHYMKVDIEGVDMVCVNALKRFRNRPNYISIESDRTDFAAIKREIDTLVELGYDSFQAVEQSTIPRSQSPPYPAREGDCLDHRFEDGSSGLFGLELTGDWQSYRKILRRYRRIRLGYHLEAVGGIAARWRFRGAHRLHLFLYRLSRHLTSAEVGGWHDTHARHSSVATGKKQLANRG
jgi:FkbM family methyltransferase